MGLDLFTVNQQIQVAIDALEENNWEKALTNINHCFNIITELAESSVPELSIKKIKNIQVEDNKWNELKLEICNNPEDLVQALLTPSFEFHTPQA